MLFTETKVGANSQDHLTYSFCGFVLDVDRAALSKDGVEIPLRPKSFDVLVYLIKHQGVLVSKEDLMGAIWPEVVVTEDSLTQCLIEVRKALADKSRNMVRTLPRRGYLFDVPVQINEPVRNTQVAGLSRGLLSRRRPSAWSAAAILFLAIAMGVFWWNSGDNSSTISQVSAAQQHFIKGQFFHDRRADGDLKRAIAEFEQAVSIDPGLADAWVGLAGSIFVQARSLGGGLETVGADYSTYLFRALEIDPDHAEAHMRTACYQMYRGDLELARQHLDQALEHGQNSALVMSMYAGMLFDQWQLDEAVERQRRAVELDPLGAVNRANLAVILQSAGRFHESQKEFLAAIDLKNDASEELLSLLSDTYILLNQPAEATELMQKLSPGLERDRIQVMADSSSGSIAETQIIVDGFKRMDGVKPAFYLAEYYSFHNLKEDAFHWLSVASERHLGEGSTWLMNDWLLNESRSPYLKVLHDDLRWENWLKSMNHDGADGHSLLLAQSGR